MGGLSDRWAFSIDTPTPPVTIVSHPPSAPRVPVSEPIDDLEANRLDKLRRIEALGVDPWGSRFDGRITINELLKLPSDLQEGERPRVRIAGRVVSRRDGGKVFFLDIKDCSGQPTVRETKAEREG